MQGQLRVEHTAVRAIAGPCHLGVALLRETERQVGPPLCLYAFRAVRDPAGRSQGPMDRHLLCLNIFPREAGLVPGSQQPWDRVESLRDSSAPGISPVF